jgi:hypothetical protein
VRGTKGGAIIGLGVALAVALLGFAASFALADPGNGNGPPPTVPGSPGGVCSQGASDNPCSPDPQPSHGQDCEDHGAAKGNENHCAGATTQQTQPTTQQTESTQQQTQESTQPQTQQSAASATTAPTTTATIAAAARTTTPVRRGPLGVPAKPATPARRAPFRPPVLKRAPFRPPTVKLTPPTAAPPTSRAVPKVSTPKTLPFTGLSLGWYAIGGMLAVMLGMVLCRAFRERKWAKTRVEEAYDKLAEKLGT